MLTIEEYISRRKKEDGIDEFNIENRSENTRIFVNYVFEFFNNYIDITEYEERTALKDEKLDKFGRQLEEYDNEVANWLVQIYSEYGKKINLNIGKIVKEDEFFWIYNTDEEFRRISYDCYARLVKKLPFIKDQTEMLFKFIKEYHYVQSKPNWQDSDIASEKINCWLNLTWEKYHVNLFKFAYNWAEYFFNNENLWPTTHRTKSKYNFRKYDYTIKQKSNLFNIDSLYRKMPKKNFIKGKKQELEILMMYYWLHSLEGDDENYWDEYLEKTLPSLE